MEPIGEPLTPGQAALFDKAARMIDGAQPRHRACLERWLSLMNARVRSEPVTFALAGASLGLKARFEGRFGPFRPAAQPVAQIDQRAAEQAAALVRATKQ